MGWLQKIFGSAPPPQQAAASGDPQHAVLLHLKLSNDAFGTPDEVKAMHALQDDLDRAIRAAAAGELDGDEFGGGYCVIYMYGPDAEKLWDAIAPVLETRPFLEGSHAMKRPGPPGVAGEDRIDLHWEG